MMTKDASCSREVKRRIVMAKAAFSRNKTFHPEDGLKFKEETGEVLHLELGFV
jgi:hypothetical protein